MKKLSFVLLFLSLSSCSLFEPKPESEKFYCKLNGKAWRPEKGSYSLGTPLKAEWNKKGRFTIYAFNGKELVLLSVKLNLNESLKIGNYLLGSVISENTGDYYYDQTITNSERLTSKSGILNISKTENNQVSGTFEFTTHSNIQNKDYKITKGQFNNLYYSEF